MTEHVAERLRALRKRAGLSMRKAAAACGLKGGSGYQRYEDPALFRAEFLSVSMARKLAAAFAGRGQPPIHPDEVLALAGLPSGAYTPPPPKADPATQAEAVNVFVRAAQDRGEDIGALGEVMMGAGAAHCLMHRGLSETLASIERTRQMVLTIGNALSRPKGTA